jgi:hypothetical protein
MSDTRRAPQRRLPAAGGFLPAVEQPLYASRAADGEPGVPGRARISFVQVQGESFCRRRGVPGRGVGAGAPSPRSSGAVAHSPRSAPARLSGYGLMPEMPYPARGGRPANDNHQYLPASPNWDGLDAKVVGAHTQPTKEAGVTGNGVPWEGDPGAAASSEPRRDRRKILRAWESQREAR